jgi:hypothetical protein
VNQLAVSTSAVELAKAAVKVTKLGPLNTQKLPACSEVFLLPSLATAQPTPETFIRIE